MGSSFIPCQLIGPASLVLNGSSSLGKRHSQSYLEMLGTELEIFYMQSRCSTFQKWQYAFNVIFQISCNIQFWEKVQSLIALVLSWWFILFKSIGTWFLLEWCLLNCLLVSLGSKINIALLLWVKASLEKITGVLVVKSQWKSKSLGHTYFLSRWDWNKSPGMSLNRQQCKLAAKQWSASWMRILSCIRAWPPNGWHLTL